MVLIATKCNVATMVFISVHGFNEAESRLAARDNFALVFGAALQSICLCKENREEDGIEAPHCT